MNYAKTGTCKEQIILHVIETTPENGAPAKYVFTKQVWINKKIKQILPKNFAYQALM